MNLKLTLFKIWEQFRHSLKFFKFKAKVPDLEDYIGRSVKIPGVRDPVIIGSIKGNVGMSLGRENPKPTYYEINGKHLIGMLRFHAQMVGDTSITEQQFRDFEEMEFEVEKPPEVKTS